MKILQVNCVWDKGSTGKIVRVLHEAYQDHGFESVVCYGRGQKTSEKNIYKTCSEWYSHLNNLISRFTGVIYAGCFFSTNKLLRIIDKEKPDIVHLHCINGYFVNIYRLLDYLKSHGIKTVLTLHAEFMYTGGCGYSLDCDKWRVYPGCGKCPRNRKISGSLFFDRTAYMLKKMKRSFEGFAPDSLCIVSVSPWLNDRASSSPVLSGIRNMTVFNGLDTSVFRHSDSTGVRKKLGISSDEKIIFHATPMFTDNIGHVKGGYWILRMAEMMKDRNVRFVIAGPHADISVPDNVILLGMISDQKELAEYYSSADVTVIASKSETFSMVVAESLCCGTPVAGFKAGAPEVIGIEGYSRFCEYGDIESLCGIAEELMQLSCSDRIGSEAQRKYGSFSMTGEYIRLAEEMCSDNRKDTL